MIKVKVSKTICIGNKAVEYSIEGEIDVVFADADIDKTEQAEALASKLLKQLDSVCTNAP